VKKLGWDAVLRRGMRFSGSARFSDIADGLSFDEEGILSFAGHRGPAMQRYRFEPCGSVVTVRFADGRLFHRIDLATGKAAASHECAPDVYEGRYRVLGPDQWLVTWRVSGPRKRQVIASRFCRALPGWDGHAAAGVAR
jgi:hypothetical protein